MLVASAVPLPPLTAATAASAWTLDPAMAVLGAALLAGYGWGVVRVHRGGGTWPLGRSLLFALVGVGSLVAATMSCLAVYRPVLFWPAALANTILAIVTPMGLALGDPITLVRRAWPRSAGPWLWRRLHGPLARAAMFPLVSVVLGVAGPFALYFTPYFAASLAHPLVREVAWLQLVASGLLFVLPIMGEDLLPAWCTWPARAALAFADGLADALPGMIIALSPSVLTGSWYAVHARTWGPSIHWDQTIGGTLILTTTEAVGIPLLVAVFVAWARADAREAREVDAALDAAQDAATARTPTSVAGVTPEQEPELQRPWWETEPGALRGRRYGP